MKIERAKLVEWIRQYISGHAKGVVLGISGGKDSLIVAALCSEAMGKENVFGVVMPCGQQRDLNDALESCKLLGIEYTVINIGDAFDNLAESIKTGIGKSTLIPQTTINIKPRLRTNVLYAIASEKGYFVANTSNLSEKVLGYSTKWGDNVGDFAPIIDFTKSEVVEMGSILGLPERLVKKMPADGLSGRTDEDAFGFTYDELDKLIRTGVGDKGFVDKVTKIYFANKHKHNNIYSFKSKLFNYFENK